MTTTTLGEYVLLHANTHCHNNGLFDITDASQCFNGAGPLVGLSGLMTMQIDNIGFTGCIYNTAGTGTVMFGMTNWVTPETTHTLGNWQYVCKRNALVVYP